MSILAQNQSQPDATSGFWRRARNIYTVIAITGFNTALLIVTALLAIDLLLPHDLSPETLTEINTGKIVPVGVGTEYSSRFNRNAYYFMNPGEVNQLLREMDTWAAEGHWQVNPWTGLTSRPFAGQFLNIKMDGERQSAPPSPEHMGQSPLIIWVFGGSTTFGWGLADDYTIPSQLQVILQNEIPNHQVQITNYAVPIYNSAQELALFAALLRRSTPDIAIFMDGVNDVWFTMYANNPTSLVDPLAAVWEDHIGQITDPFGQAWITFNPSFPVYRLAHQWGLNPGEIPAQGYDPRYAFQGTGAVGPQYQMRFAIENYRANQRMATAISDELGVKPYFLLQPWEDPFYPAFGQGIIQEGMNDHFFDLTAVFEDVNTDGKLLLVDDLHYSDYASNILAARIADIILKTYDLGD